MSGPWSIADDVIPTADIDCSAAPATLDPGAQFECTATYSITQAGIDNGTVDNTATAEGLDPNGDSVVSPAVVETVTAVLSADMSITKVVTDGSTTHIPGDQITYTLTVTNLGPSQTTTTTVTDTLPVDTTFVSATPDAGSCSETTGVVTCDLGAMASGDTVTTAVTVAVDPSSTATIENTASVSSDLPDPEPANDSATVSTTPVPTADLRTEKTGPANYVPGEPITYTVTVTNDGPSTALDVETTDVLPAGVTYDPVASSSDCSETAGTVTCTPVDLAVGEQVSYTIVVDTTADMAADLTNTATAQSTTFDPDNTNNTADTTASAAPEANLVVAKTGPVGPIQAGTQVTYTITVSNDGPSDATTVEASDPLPAGTTFVSASVTGGDATETCDGTILCQLGTIAAGATETITVVLDVNPDFTGDLTNTVTASTDTPGDDPIDNTGSHTVTVVEASDVTITKIDSVDPVVAGQNLTYTVAVDNAGPSQATSVEITDTLPPEVTFVDAPGCTYDEPSHTVTCDVGTLAALGSASFDITVTVNADTVSGTTLSNTANVNAPSDTNTGDNSATELTDVVRQADVTLTKTSSPNPFVPGQPVTYTVLVTNAGPSDADNVQVSDDLPADFIFSSVTPAECGEATGTVSCSLGTLAAGDSVQITIVGMADPSATELTNTATATTDTPDPDLTNNEATDVNTGDPQADLEVTKLDSVDPVIAGTALTYTISVTNNGPSDASDVSVADSLPAGFVIDSVDRTQCDLTVDCTFGVIAAGGTEVIVITGSVDPATTDTGDPLAPELANVVTVTSATTDPDPTNNNATETTDVVESADVVLTKTGEGTTVTPGEQMTFTIDVTNLGPSVADNVVVTDSLPAGLTVSSLSSTIGSCSDTGGTITCDLGTMTVAADATITVVVDVASDFVGDIVNEASVTSDTPDPNPANNTDDSQDPTVASADLGITKTDLADPVQAGNSFSYQLTVINNGSSDAQGVTITDVLPAETSFVSYAVVAGSPTCDHDGSASGGTFSCDPMTVAAGDVVTVEVTVTVDSATADATVINNTASVSATTDDPTPGNNSATEPTTIETSAGCGRHQGRRHRSGDPGRNHHVHHHGAQRRPVGRPQRGCFRSAADRSHRQLDHRRHLRPGRHHLLAGNAGPGRRSRHRSGGRH